jgi:hypothetical protein
MDMYFRLHIDDTANKQEKLLYLDIASPHDFNDNKSAFQISIVKEKAAIRTMMGIFYC